MRTVVLSLYLLARACQADPIGFEFLWGGSNQFRYTQIPVIEYNPNFYTGYWYVSEWNPYVPLWAGRPTPRTDESFAPADWWRDPNPPRADRPPVVPPPPPCCFFPDPSPDPVATPEPAGQAVIGVIVFAICYVIKRIIGATV